MVCWPFLDTCSVGLPSSARLRQGSSCVADGCYKPTTTPSEVKDEDVFGRLVAVEDTQGTIRR